MTAPQPHPGLIARRLFQAGFIGFAVFAPFSIAGMTVSLGLAGAAWIVDLLSPGQSPPLHRDPLAVPALALAVLALPSVFLSDDSARAFGDWKSYWQLLIYFAVAGYVAQNGLRNRVIDVLAGATIVSCLVAFVQRAGGLHVGWLHIGAEHRVSSTLYTMTFAGILAQLIVFFLGLSLIRTHRPARRVVYAVATAFALVALLFTMTRGAWIALAAGGVTLCLVLRRRELFIAAAVGVAILFVFSVRSGKDEGRTFSPSAIMHSAPDRNVHTRLVLWRIAWDLFREHPWLGVGMGDYTREADRLVSERGDRGVLTTVDAHNVPLHTLATRGLVGFLPFAAYWTMVFVVLVRTMRAGPRGSPEHHMAGALVAVTVVLLVGSLTENNIDDEEVFNVYLFLLGVARSSAYPFSIDTSST